MRAATKLPPLRHALRPSLPLLLHKCSPLTPQTSTTTTVTPPTSHISVRTAHTIKWIDLPPPSQLPPRPNKYQLAYNKSMDDPKQFWGDNAKEEIHWYVVRKMHTNSLCARASIHTRTHAHTRPQRDGRKIHMLTYTIHT